MDCRLCDLNISRTKVVLGIGNDTADIMIIGEAPGYYEDKKGEPFVGKSGQYLRKVLSESGFAIDELFITNVVKCRPPGNRTPHPVEISTCTKAFLSREIQHIKPIFVITAGSTATDIMTSDKIPMHKQVLGFKIVGDMYVFPIYHPSYILQNENLAIEFSDRLKKIREQISSIYSKYAFEIAAYRTKNINNVF